MTLVFGVTRVFEPSSFDAVTQARSRRPTSLLARRYVADVASAMGLHRSPRSVHRRHWYAKLVGEFDHEPRRAVSLLPARAVPVMVGAARFVGAAVSSVVPPRSIRATAATVPSTRSASVPTTTATARHRSPKERGIEEPCFESTVLVPEGVSGPAIATSPPEPSRSAGPFSPTTVTTPASGARTSVTPPGTETSDATSTKSGALKVVADAGPITVFAAGGRSSVTAAGSTTDAATCPPSS